MSNLTACVACNPEEITNNGLCQACPEGQVPNANQTVCEVQELELENGGQDCWHACNAKQGKCIWCGKDGWCCMQTWIGNGCDGTIGGSGNHQCVLNPSG